MAPEVTACCARRQPPRQPRWRHEVVGLAEAVQTVLGKYADFSGRARRSEYWYWTLALLIAYVVLFILAAIAKPFLFLLIVFYLAILVPSIAVGARRLHDTDRSGWWLLLGIVPFGGLVLLVFFCMEGTPGPNSHGADPKGGTGYAA